MRRPDPALDEAGSEAPGGDFDPHAAEDSVLDEILQYASGKQASGLKDKYFPAPPAPQADPAEPDGDDAIPGVEAEGAAEGEAPAGDSEITPEQMALLEKLLQSA